MKFRFMVVAVCALALQACATLGIETCGLGATRCKGNTVQVCKTGFGWSDSASCEDIASAAGGAWTCSAPKGACGEYHQCVPEKVEKKPEPQQKPAK
jgi:hypothetical protein